MKVKIIDIKGKEKGTIELPKVFDTPHRPDLIKRFVLAAHANKRQPYGANKLAGMRTSAHYEGSRHVAPDQMMMNREMARLPRIHGHSPAFLSMRARVAPQTVKGRRAHPPKAEKIWSQKMNSKERKLSLKSAIAATANIDIVKERGHKVKAVPIIVDGIESIEKTKDMVSCFESIGLSKEIERSKKKKIRPGKGTMRGRKYRKKVGPLIVLSDLTKAKKASKNIPGVQYTDVKNLNTELLSPGAHGARLTIWSKQAIGELEKFYKGA